MPLVSRRATDEARADSRNGYTNFYIFAAVNSRNWCSLSLAWNPKFRYPV